MNLFSKLLLTVTAFLCVSSAHAIDVSAYYIGGCERVIGVPLQVSASSISILTLEGEIKKLPRYEITYVASYPIDVVPFTRVSDTSVVPPVRVSTRQHEQLVELVAGWPVEFTDQKIAFLTTTGEGLVIDKNAIWSIDESSQTHFEFADRPDRKQVNFVHPQVFDACPSAAPKDAARTVAQQLLSEPVAIKREFDRLQKGHELIASYEAKEKFYPYPHIYSNDTLLGLWTSANSRYGSSGFRSNNFTPLLQSDLNLGPFSYQHRFITGSGPIFEGSHEEAQTQATYDFKADYFRLGLMTDLSQILIGAARYKWSAGDLDSTDFRVNDVGRIEFGIDYGAYSLILIPIHGINVGARVGDAFAGDTVSLSRFGFAFRKPAYEFEITTGAGKGNAFELSLLRMNGRFELNSITSLLVSYIHRTSKYNSDAAIFDHFESTSDTGAAWLEHRYRKRFPLGVTASVEHLSISTGGTATSTFAKGGVFFGLIF